MNIVSPTGSSAAEICNDTLVVRHQTDEAEAVLRQGELVVLLVAPAAVALQEGLSNGFALTEALARWKASVSALLPVQRHARDRICLVLEPAALADPFGAKKAVAAWAGRSVQPNFPQESSVPENDPTQELIAQLMVAADPEAIRLDGELEAAVLVWPGMRPWSDAIAIDDLYERHRRFTEASLPPALLQQLRLEMAAQREELHAFEAEIEGEAFLRARLVDLEAEHDRLREAHNGLMDWLAQIERSRSWRITAPLRAVNRLRGG